MDNKKNFGEVSEEDIALAQSAAPDDLKEKPPLDIKNELFEWAESFVFAIFIMLLVFTFCFRIVVVDGDSMNDTLVNKDRLVLSHINYTPKKNDIVIINSKGLNKTIIKRVIGTSGDEVEVDYNSNTVKVNGEKISNDNIKPEAMIDKGDFYFDTKYMTSEGVYKYKVPDDSVFVMGDNRNHSTDSRSAEVGFVKNDDILGKAVLRLYPMNDFGSVK